MSSPRKVRQLQVIQRARVILEKYGWQQGAVGTPGTATPHCAAGAIQSALYEIKGRTSIGSDYCVPLRRVLRRKGCSPYIVNWNDQKGRTKREVIAVFIEAEQLLLKEMND